MILPLAQLLGWAAEVVVVVVVVGRGGEVRAVSADLSSPCAAAPENSAVGADIRAPSCQRKARPRCTRALRRRGLGTRWWEFAIRGHLRLRADRQ